VLAVDPEWHDDEIPDSYRHSGRHRQITGTTEGDGWSVWPLPLAKYRELPEPRGQTGALNWTSDANHQPFT
jgi:hypothetical protein